MAERHVIGSDLAPNKELNGSGSTAVAGWISSAAEKWALVSIGAVTPTVAEFTEWQGRRSLHLNIASASAGAVVGVSQIPEYSAATITSASLPYLIKMKQGHSYTVSCDVYVPTGAVNCNPSLLRRQYTNVLARTGLVAALTNSTRDSWVTLTTTFTALANETYYAFLIGLTQDSASTFSGEMYISNISMVDNTETARTLATSRSTATNRVAVRDMGTALRFDGVNDEVTTPIDSTKFDPTQPFTITFELMDIPFVTTSLGVAGMWLASAGQRNFGILIGSTRRVSFVMRNASDVSVNSDASVSVRRSMRNFVAVRFNGTHMQAYVNGSWNTETAITPAAAGAQAILIGRANAAANPFYKGRIDNFRVFQKALSDAEVDNLNFMNIVPQDGLVAEYLFDEATGTTAIDTSGNGNHGTITGATYTLDVPLEPRASI